MSAKIKSTNTKTAKMSTGKKPSSNKGATKKSSVVKIVAKKTTKPAKAAKVGAAKKAVAKQQTIKKTVPKKTAVKPTAKKAQPPKNNVKKQLETKKISVGNKTQAKVQSKGLKATPKIVKPNVATRVVKHNEKVAAIAPLQKKVTKAPTKAKQKTMTKAEMKLKEDVVFTPPISTMKIFGVEPYHPVANEEYMNEMQRAHFRQILINWKKELMEEVDRTMVHMKDDVQRYADPNDIASQEEEFNLELRARDRERKLIRKIDSSLLQIEQDDYGYCEACGIEIGIRRLEARPTADLCIDCKTLDEIREKQTKA